MDQRQFLQQFRQEGDELVTQLRRGLAELSRSRGGPGPTEGVAAAAHKLKGAANVVGIGGIGAIAQRTEEVVREIQAGRAVWTPALGEALRQAVDAMQVLVAQSVDKGAGPPVFPGRICESLAAFLPTRSAVPAVPGPAAAPPAAARPSASPEAASARPATEESEADEFLQLFRDEAKEHLDKLNQGLLDLEKRPADPEVLSEITRAAHTLKGSSKMMGFDSVGAIAHRMEDLLKRIRDGEQVMEDEIADHLFAALDAMRILIAVAPGTEVDSVDVGALCGQLDQDAGLSGTVEPEVPAAPAPARAVPSPLAKAFGPAAQPEAPAPTAAGQVPPAPAATPAPPALAASPAPDPSARPRAAESETIRIGTTKVDALVNVAGEMVGTQIRFEDRFSALKRLNLDLKEILRHWHHLREDLLAMAALGEGGTEQDATAVYDEVRRLSHELAGFGEKLGAHVRRTSDDTVHLTLMTSELHREVMDLRMMPVAPMFDSFRRTIRDLAREMGKEVRPEILGRETELDKKMIEMIKDPLVHLVRNSIDHGIETPEERVRTGKPAEGTVRLSARQEGDHILIEVSDDGRGIDADRVRRAAEAKGILSPEEARALSDRDAYHLIFRPNFSTREEVTETSGRGVGMDVVKTNVENLKGEVRIQTERGKGTTFILALPLTLAVTRVLTVELSGYFLAIPTSAVFLTAKIPLSEVKSIERREAVRIRGRTIPLVHLADVLGLPAEEHPAVEKLSVVIVEYADEQLAFVVDKVLGEQEIVIKNLGDHLQSTANLAGAALVGSGDILFVLHVPDLFSSAKTATRRRRTASPAAGVTRRKRILVVEDSLTSRELERNLLQAHGYDVDTAVDGLDGLSKISGQDYDLLVADIAMPRLDGFQMIRKIKEDEALRRIPIVIVSARDQEEYRRKGFELGVEAYVVKTAFDQTSLLDTIQRLIGDV